MKTPDLKLCQAAARGSIRWREDFQQDYLICQADCAKYDCHAAERISMGNLDGFTALVVERNVLQHLCKGCKEAMDDESERVP